MSRVIPPFSSVTAALFALTACSASPPPVARDSAAFPEGGAAPAARRADAESSSASPAASGPRPVADAAQQAFTRILSQRTTGFDEGAELVIRERAALESSWARVFNQVQGNPAPAVDFARESVILVALGTRRTGGHDVRVDAITRSGDGAVVRYTATSPGPGCITTQGVTSPVDVVRTARIAGTVRFERQDVVQGC